jgi:hypothetical protein
MEKVCERPNLLAALKRVRRNKGSPGIDGMTVDELSAHLRKHWPRLREQVLAGTYQPAQVKQQLIPKANGGMRKLGIPTVVDRFIQQALLQVLQPMFDPDFSKHSHGFRPGHRAHDAIVEAQGYIQAGRKWVVDVDLEQFLDRVKHDVLMGRLAKRIGDGRVLKRGHAFVRYADDCNTYVQSRRAGERVLKLLRRLYARLRLQINEAKSAVDLAWKRKILSYSFWVAKDSTVRRRVADKALATMKDKVREITKRSGGRSIEQVCKRLGEYLRGWKEYFGLAQTPRIFDNLDRWIRRRLRVIHLKHWGQQSTVYRELRARGMSRDAAMVVAVNCRRWWMNSARMLNVALPNSYFDQLGIPRLATQPQLPEPPGADPHAGWCGRGP